MTTPTLPPLSDERVDALERRIFARIDTDRAARRRRRAHIGGWSVAAAAIVLVAAMVGPAVVNGGSTSLADQSVAGASGGARTEQDGAPRTPELKLLDGTTIEAAPDTPVREVIANGSATVEVGDVSTAVRTVSDAATSAGGYVESSQVGGAATGAIPIEGDARAQNSPANASTAWITVRVPADALTRVIDGLSAVGTVTASNVTRSDVTDQTVDLRARVTAAEASVARLTELMSQAGSVSDLIAAESALADRQAQLDADRQQLALLESQVAMSSLTVQVVPAVSTVAADPAGFGDGLTAGWNGLVATLNGVVIGLGFLLPWLVVAAVIFGVVGLVRRARRRRSSSTDT